MKILSSFTHPQVDPNLYDVFVLNTKEDILKKEFVIRLFWDTIDFIVGENTALFPSSFRISQLDLLRMSK